MTKHDSENFKITPDEFKRMSSEEKILKMASGLVPPTGKSRGEVLDSILNKTEQTPPAKTFKIGRILQVAAAVIIILIGLKYIPSLLSGEQLKTSFAEQTEIILPDGTNVTLNAGSKIIWNDKNFTKKRKLTLKGEAFFDVKKGDQFIINTPNGTVEILGTQLNVFSRENNFWVSCISGKVRVSAHGQQQVITPGELVQLNDTGGIQKSKSGSIENTISWREGVFHFEEAPLANIFNEMERQFDISIKFDGNEKRLANVDFTNESLEKALEVVCIPMELNYEIKNKKIIIHEKD